MNSITHTCQEFYSVFGDSDTGKAVNALNELLIGIFTGNATKCRYSGSELLVRSLDLGFKYLVNKNLEEFVQIEQSFDLLEGKNSPYSVETMIDEIASNALDLL